MNRIMNSSIIGILSAFALLTPLVISHWTMAQIQNTTLPENNTTNEVEKVVDSNYADKLREKIIKRLNDLLNNIGSDKNLVEEEQRLRVIDNYIKILEKIKLFE